MKVEIKISAQIKEPYAQLYAAAVTEEIRRAAELLEGVEEKTYPEGRHVIVANAYDAAEKDRLILLEPAEIYMARMENKEVVIYCENKKFTVGKKLYELEELLGQDFMRISKSTIVNLKKIDSVEPSFNAMMYLVMKNGCRDYITRTYLKEFRRYLGL